jgi:hypothetical protein
MAITVPPELEIAEARIRAIVDQAREPVQPRDMIADLTREGLPEYFVRIAIWTLIDRREIELTPELTLAPINQGAPISAAPGR